MFLEATSVVKVFSLCDMEDKSSTRLLGSLSSLRVILIKTFPLKSVLCLGEGVGEEWGVGVACRTLTDLGLSKLC